MASDMQGLIALVLLPSNASRGATKPNVLPKAFPELEPAQTVAELSRSARLESLGLLVAHRAY